MPASLEVTYYNSYWGKKLPGLATQNYTAAAPVWSSAYVPVSGGVNRPQIKEYAPGGPYPWENQWYIEEARIKGGYNNTSTDLGVNAHLVEEEPQLQRRGNAMIYSGIFNSRTGINQTNVFSVADNITKAVDPRYGSIQKLYAEDTRLIIFQEEKVSSALIDKDAIYTAEGGNVTTLANVVIGSIVPYAGEYGISTNPESFAVYGYRKYFADKNKNAILRLSADGITEISSYGMKDWFRDNLAEIGPQGKIVGGWDIHNKQYTISLQNNSTNYNNTLIFDEAVLGWTAFMPWGLGAVGTNNDYVSTISSLRNIFYTTRQNSFYQHYSSITPYNNFYGQQGEGSIEFVFNGDPSIVKNFRTVNYEGSNNWKMEFLRTEYEQTKEIASYINGSYPIPGVQTPQQLGFWEKEGKYFANVIGDGVNSGAADAYKGRVIIDDSEGQSAKSGVKGFTANVKFVADNTQVAELFAVSSVFNVSSY